MKYIQNLSLTIINILVLYSVYMGYLNVLSSILVTPLLGLVWVIILTGIDMPIPRKNILVKYISLGNTITTFVISLIAWYLFDSSNTEYQLVEEIYILGQYSNYSISLGLDGLSLYFVLLTTLIIPICVLSHWQNITKSVSLLIACFLLLELLLISVFLVIDLLLFYIFFESVLVPLFVLVGLWGGSNIRVRAAFLLFLYTLLGSLSILLAFLVIFYNIGSTSYTLLGLIDISLGSQKILWLAIFLSIAVKTPLLPFNTWLTYAHSEAPVGGSILLAGVILKLATYGYLRVIIQLLPEASLYFSPLVQAICLITLVYASLSTLQQTDYKKLVAYSSVAHISVVVLGLFSNSIQGIEGAIILSIAHGLVSPAIFYLVGGVLYDRYHSRDIRYFRGLTNYIPLFSILFFLFSIFNAAVPLSANWIGEFLCLIGLFQQNILVAGLASLGIVFSAAYSIWLYNRMCFGSWSTYLGYTIDLSRREFILLLPLLLLTILLGIYPNIVLDTLHISVSQLVYTVT